MNRNVWNDGAGYESYVGQWSRVIGPHFIRWLAPKQGLDWLDLACGTGALTEAVVESAILANITGVDRSEGYLSYARQRIHADRVRFEVADAYRLPFPDATFDVVVSGLALNFIDADLAMAEQRRVAVVGGLVGAYVWDYSGAYELVRFFWDSASQVDSAASAHDPGKRFSLCNVAALEDLFVRHGVTCIRTTTIDEWASFPTFDAYWQALDVRQGSMAEYLLSLSNEKRLQIRARLNENTPRLNDGTIRLRLRALAVKGLR